jgi:hypothetical protein
MSRFFTVFVIIHNVFLALLSFWAFLSVGLTLRKMWPIRSESGGMAAVVHMFCKLGGNDGLRNATQYETTSNVTRDIAQREQSLTSNASNIIRSNYAQELFYVFWVIYVSKFYEAMDTLIILLKGKRVSILQMYHHAGVMICAWAGYRYMSPAVTIGVLLNTAIHTLMVGTPFNMRG